MPLPVISLPPEAPAALAILRDESKHTPVVLFKRSPRCPISFHAEAQFDEWRKAADGAAVAIVDVVTERELARGITALLEIQHESPQALLFHGGDCVWHDSHDRLTTEAFEQRLAERSGRQP